MPTEAEVIVWISQNWPSLVLTGILFRAYLRLRSFLDEIVTLRQNQSQTAKRQEKVIEVLIDLSPADTRYLCDDHQKERKKK